MKNFRDKWVGSSKGNLEKISASIHLSAGVTFFIDEADQALDGEIPQARLGSRGRIYSMLAEEMGAARIAASDLGAGSSRRI